MHFRLNENIGRRYAAGELFIITFLQRGHCYAAYWLFVLLLFYKWVTAMSNVHLLLDKDSLI